MKLSQHPKTILLSLGLISLVTGLASNPARANEITSNVRLFVGQKNLDSDDWNSLDNQTEIGVIFNIKKASWPVSIAFDVIGSGEDKNETGAERGYTIEQHLGVRKIWPLEKSTFRPYLGGGIALVHAEYEVIGSTKDNDNAIGAWIGTGIDWHLSPEITLGVDIRYSQAQVTVFDQDIEAGGLHTGITLGYRW